MNFIEQTEKYSNSEITSIASDHNAYINWMTGEYDRGLTKADIILRKRRVILNIVNEFLSESEKRYILDYLDGDLNTCEIAEKYGVHRSTVSRQITRGYKKIHRVLKCLSPELGIVEGESSKLRQSFFINPDTGRLKKKGKYKHLPRQKKGN